MSSTKTSKINGVMIAYEEHGTGEEVVVFSHGYLMNRHMFDAQIAALSSTYRVIAYDHRGHGESAKIEAPIDMYDLVDDAAALIDELVGGPVHFVGMSTGGFVAMRLMSRRPELLRSVALIDTSAQGEPPAKRAQYRAMLWIARHFGLAPLVGRTLSLLMGKPFRTDRARRDELESWKAAILALDRPSISFFGEAIFWRDDVSRQLADAKSPALVIVGELDVATPVSKAEHIARVLPNAKLERIAGAGHTSPVERPEEVTRALDEFLSSVRSDKVD